MEPFVKSDIINKIGYITFFHPSGNSFPSFQLEKLVLEIETLDQNPNVQILVIKSEGKTFCSGASFDELLSINDFESGKKFFSGFANVINAMRKCTKLIVGIAHGKAVGGGVGLLSTCDYVFATSNADIKLSELAIGIGPFVIEPAVSRKIGVSAMSEMTLNANAWKTALWAYQKGLYTEIFSDLTELDQRLENFVDQLCSFNPQALQEMKKVFWKDTSSWEKLLYERAEISGRLVLSDFARKALNNFKKS